MPSPKPSPTAIGPATWYAFLLTGFYIYAVNVQGNVVPFLQAEFALSYRAVSLHSSAIAAGIILVGLFGDRVARRLGRRKTLWLGVGGLAGGSILLTLAPAPPLGELPWASIASCFVIGALGALVPAILPALLADLHGPRRAEAYAGQAICAYVFGLAAPLIAGACIWAGLGWRAAVLFGAAVGIAIALGFRRTEIIEAPAVEAVVHERGKSLPAAYWAYWVLLIASCGLEFCILFWAPAYLERVVGFAPATAAAAAAGFPLGMLLGRIALRNLVRRVALRRLLIAALACVFAGFLIYWGVSWPPAAIAGVFLIGLGVAPLYPLSTDFAIGAAPLNRDVASMRLAIAFGLSLLLAPIALGALADEVGLGPAHLALPALILAAYASFFIGEALQKRDVRSLAEIKAGSR
jgi:MFS transporter, DHA1 family, inner membrane transport protein